MMWKQLKISHCMNASICVSVFHAPVLLVFIRCALILEDWWWSTRFFSAVSSPVGGSFCWHWCSLSYCPRWFWARTKTTTVCWESAGRPQPERSDKLSRSWHWQCIRIKILWVAMKNYNQKKQKHLQTKHIIDNTTQTKQIDTYNSVLFCILGRLLSPWKVPEGKSSLWSSEGRRSPKEIW